jgi:hypothetical protein
LAAIAEALDACGGSAEDGEGPIEIGAKSGRTARPEAGSDASEAGMVDIGGLQCLLVDITVTFVITQA